MNDYIIDIPSIGQISPKQNRARKGDVNDSSGLKSSMAKNLIEDNNLKIKIT